MEDYIKGNKEAWEEAFDHRDENFCKDIGPIVKHGQYDYFEYEMKEELPKVDLKGKTIGQFCSNNGRELLSLVKSSGAKKGIGFDIAGNMVRFANQTAKDLSLPCEFIEGNILELDDRYNDTFDFVIITIGALCWFKDLKEYFRQVSKCMKKGAQIYIHEQHPLCNMLGCPGDEGYNENVPLNCLFSYFDHEWINNGGMTYISGKNYDSKTFTDYTHSYSDIIGSMCANHMVITDLIESQWDIGGGFTNLNNQGLPLSLLIKGRKE